LRLDKETLRDLVDEKLPRAQVRAIQSGYKDTDRFDKYVEILQERVGWPEQIVLPFGEHLFITVPSAGKPADGSTEGTGKPADGSTEGTGKPADGSTEGTGKPADGSTEGAAAPSYVVRCECGHEFCDYRENWKLEALINVRDRVEDLREIYPEKMHGDPDWNVLREFFCPGCKTLLEVEAVPPGYPPVHDFVPDLEGFYEDWLGRPLPS
jgi:acetone carboxylase, gamma subunit